MSTRPDDKKRRPIAARHQTDAFPTANEIASRAHDLFVAEGRRVTRIFEYWERAEQELLNRAARQALRRT
jgi:hypothetical protein